MAPVRYYVYILASRPHGTLDVGVTSDLVRRGWEHRNGQGAGFTREYGGHRLVHFEEFGDVDLAIAREKRLKRWRRDWKIVLIEENNPDWRDLFPTLDGWSAGLRPGNH